MIDNFIIMPSAMIRRSRFDVAGQFDTEVSCNGDWYVWLRVAADGARLQPCLSR